MKKVLFSLLVFCQLMISCNPNDTPAPPAANEPKAGSKWVFRYNTYSEAGVVTATSDITFNAVEVTVGGSTWLNLVESVSGQPKIALQKRSGGWWYISYPVTTPSLWFKHPATVNETYPYVFGTCKVLSITETVVVPAGSFSNCYMIQGDDSNSKEDEFWFSSEGAILIKGNTYDEKAVGPATNVYKSESLELVSFTR